MNAQTQTIEDLKTRFRSASSDNQKLLLLLSLCEQAHNLHADTLLKYARITEQIADKLANTTAKLKAEYYEAYGLTNNGSIDSALAIADKCLQKLEKEGNDYALMAALYNQKGRCFMRKNQYSDAIEMGYKVISDGEKSRDTLLQMRGKTLIGWANLEMGRNEEALQWHLLALNTPDNEEFRSKYCILFANIALNYNGMGKTDSAFYYIEKAVRYSRIHEDLFALSNSLAIQAQLYVRSGQASLAEAPLRETVSIRKQIGDPFYIVSDMAQLGLYYANNNQPEKGIAITTEGIEIARKFNIEAKYLFLYSTLAENYKALGDKTKYAEILEKIVSLKDSIYQKNSAKAIAEMQTKYELQKKENTIIQQKFDLNRKNYFFYGSLLLTIIVLAAASLIFRNYRKRQKIELARLREDEKRSAQQAVREAEENERRRIAADLHDNLGAYAASMASNLDIIELQQTSDKEKDAFRELRNNSQAIISQLNDTIWVLKKDELSLTAISDRVKVFINRIQPSYPHIKIEVFESIDNDQELSSSEAFHLYRIIQEAINNAVKHSRGSKIIVKISSTTNWIVTITDNGTGIPGEILSGVKNSNGIENMKKRCGAEGWRIEWLSTGMGTTLMISST